jgi:CheY-like chemotaxis protein
MNETQKISIMFVDDDKFLLDMYALKFSKNGFDVRACQGPDEALKILRDGYTPNVLLLDVVMPGIDGIQLLEVIRKENLAQNSTIIMLTNQGLSEDIERAKKLHVDGYIVKAMTIPSEVLDEVQKVYAAAKAGLEAAKK